MSSFLRIFSPSKPPHLLFPSSSSYVHDDPLENTHDSCSLSANSVDNSDIHGSGCAVDNEETPVVDTSTQTDVPVNAHKLSTGRPQRQRTVPVKLLNIIQVSHLVWHTMF